MEKLDSSIHNGYCRICHNFTKLTFEHFPPKSALNSTPAKIYTGESYLRLATEINRYPWDFTNIKYKLSNRGFGGYTLCQRCNNLTGLLYGYEYKKWFYATMKSIVDNFDDYKKNEKATLVLKNVYPGRFIRQVLSIICSTYPEFSSKYQYIKEVILNKSFKYNDKINFRIYMYLLKNNYTGYTGLMHLIFPDGKIKAVNEIDMYPFGFWLCLSPYSEDEVDITSFINYGYDDKCDVTMRIKIHDKYSLYPMDFRTKEELSKIISICFDDEKE